MPADESFISLLEPWTNSTSKPYRKTSILNRFLFNKFETKYRPTVEDLFNKTFDLGSIEIEVSVQILT